MSRALLVLGAGGRVGRLLQSVWRDRDDVVFASRVPSGAQLAWTGTDAVAQLADHGPYRAVLSLVGAPYSDASLQEAQIAGEVIALARDLRVGRVMLTSSAAVYGAEEGLYSEVDPLLGSSPYARSKIALERAVADRPGTVCLRLGNVAGADSLLRARKDTWDLVAWPSGATPRRAYVSPNRFAELLLALVHADQLPSVLNISGTAVGIEMGDILDAMGLAWAAQTPDAGAVKRHLLDMARLRSIPGCDLPDESVEAVAASVSAHWGAS